MADTLVSNTLAHVNFLDMLFSPADSGRAGGSDRA